MKRVLTVQDISCLGKCSATIALPVISAMGVETVILPTALLSTHTMFKNFTWKDLTDQIRPITAHWLQEKVRFDAIYTGYLGTIGQISLMEELFSSFRTPDTCIVVDPVMGDNGRLYTGFDEAYAKKNAELCGCADIIVPNITEAAIMTGTPYREEYGEDYIRGLLQRLAELGPKIAVLTGVSLSPGRTGVMGLDTSTGEYFLYQNRKIDVNYHGTGDLFSAVCVGGMMRGLSWQKAMELAADHTAFTIDVTRKNKTSSWYGVDFEETIPALLSGLEEYRKPADV